MPIRFLSKSVVALLLGALVLVGCDVSDEADPVDTPFQSVADIVRDVNNFTTLQNALTAADLLTALEEGQGEFTLFAPDNATFATFDANTGGILGVLLEEDDDGNLANGDALASLLSVHVVPGRVAAADLSDGQTLEALGGGQLAVRVVGGTTYVGGAPVINTDTPATNGLVHTVGQVLTSSLSATELASLAPDLSTLAAELVEAELDDDLEGGALTVFAPTDDAFGGIDTDDDAGFNSLDQARQTDVLEYHVVGSVAEAFDIGADETFTTLDGGTIAVDGSDGVVVNGRATVVVSYTVSNGVVHVVDTVLLENLNVVERAIVTSNLTELQDAVVAAGLAETLATTDGITVFAPSDDAFGAIQEDDAEEAGFLAEILQYHVVPDQRLAAADLMDGMTLGTLADGDLTVSVADGAVSVNGASVVAADIDQTNGVVHIIDRVLLENLDVVERAIVMPELDSLVNAVVDADLAETLATTDGITVFAPNNAAFAAIQAADADEGEFLDALLQYHVVPQRLAAGDLMDGMTLETLTGAELTVAIDEEGNVSVNGASVVLADAEADNGIIHVIDAVLLEDLNVVEQAIVTPGLDALVDAVVDAGLADALATTPNITVFAPSDAAFDAAADTLGSYDLSDVLTYHVLPAQSDGTPLAADEITDDLSVETLNGASITFDLPEDGGVFINPMVDGEDTTYQAEVVATDIRATNGLIHLVDGVLLPPLDDDGEGEED